MTLETLISWIGKDLKQGSGAALGVAILASVAGLFTATATILIMPLGVETIVMAHIANDRVYFAPPKHWQDAKAYNSQISVRCRDSELSIRQAGKEDMTISIAKPRSLSCRNSERPIVLFSYDISLWALAKHKILKGVEASAPKQRTSSLSSSNGMVTVILYSSLDIAVFCSIVAFHYPEIRANIALSQPSARQSPEHAYPLTEIQLSGKFAV
jgi:hypothetical protein